jgi:hypothetical protein
MLELNREQRGVLANKLADIANISAGALIFGQLVGVGGVSILKMVGGAALWLVLLAGAIVAAGRGEP